MNKTHFIIEGVLGGLLICETIAIWRMRKSCGTLQVDRKGEKELYRFEIVDFDGLSNKKFVRLKVDNNANLSQK